MTKPKDHPAGTVESVLAQHGLRGTISPIERQLAVHLNSNTTPPKTTNAPDIDLGWNHAAKEQV